MTRNWATFLSISIVAVILGAITVVGPAGGLFGSASNEADAPATATAVAVDPIRVQPSAADPYGEPPANAVPSEYGPAADLIGVDEAEFVAVTPPVDASAGALAASPSTASPAPASIPDAEPGDAATVVTYAIGDAGIVTLHLVNGRLQIDAVAPTTGWETISTESSGDAAEIRLRRGSEELRFLAVLIDGQIQVDLQALSLDGPAATAPPDATSGAVIFAVADAGFVTLEVRDGALQLLAVEPAAGWSVAEIEEEEGEIEVEFRRGGEEVEFAARAENGEIRTYIETEDEYGASGPSEEE